MRLLLVALLTLAAPSVFAQDGPRASRTPDSVLAPGALDAEFRAWRAEVGVHGRFGASFLLRGQRYHVLVLTPMAVDLLAADSLIVTQGRACQEALQLPDSLVAALPQLRPWEDFDSATAARPVVAFTVLPADPIRMDCGKGELPRFAAIARGAAFGVRATYDADFDARHAELRRNGVLQPALLLGTAPVTKVVGGAMHLDGTNQLRLYVPPEVFAPSADGADADLALFVQGPRDDAPDILPVPAQLSRGVWQQFLPWRARQLGADGTPPREPLAMEFRVPRDSALRASHEQFVEGRWGASASTVLMRLARRPMARQTETRDAMVQAAAVFAAYGETATATTLMADVLAEFPCLTVSPTAPASLRAIVDEAPRTARCTSQSLPLLAVAGVVPGGGQWLTPGRRRYGATLLVATLGSFAVAQGLHAYSRRAYDDYLRNNGSTITPASADFRRAELGRKLGNAMTVGAISVWSYAAVEGVVMEWRHTRRIAAVREVGRPRGLRLSVAPLPSGVGVRVGFP